MKTTSIAITGGIGSGKSSVSRLLSAYCCAPILDVDILCRDLVDKGEPGWLALQRALGSDFFLADATLDRRKLRECIFHDPGMREKVDSVLHPIIREKILSVLKAASGFYFVDIPLLYEVGWQDQFAAVVVAYADEQVQCDRIMQRDKVSYEQARESVASQMELKKKRAMADYVIENSGTWKEARIAVIRLAEQIEKKYL